MTVATTTQDLIIQPLDTPAQPAKTPIGQKLALGAVLLFSAFVNLYNLGQNGFGNLFYAASIRSMTDNLYNFFFASYDPGGFMSIDKPPLGFWLQAISAKIFGFTPFSVLFPQAVAGVLSVLVLYILVRRHFGFTAGLLAALALAVSPLSVATNRDETIDTLLVLILLLGAWAIMKAAENGKWRWLLLSAVLVGVAFNIKTLEAYLVLPAFGLLYLLTAPRRFRVRIGQLAVALVVLLAVSLSWLVVIDMTPASQRPYVGSSQNNSEISLAFGYNGIQRLTGSSGDSTTSGTPEPMNIIVQFLSIVTGPFALIGPFLGGQIAWFLPGALLAIFALSKRWRPPVRGDYAQHSRLLWSVWLITMVAFFSISHAFILYYMTVLAPAICALFGIGMVVMWQNYKRGSRLLPIALLLTALEQIFIIAVDPDWGAGLILVITLFTVLALLALTISRRNIPHLTSLSSRVLGPVLGLAVAALLLTPAIWSAIPALQNTVTVVPKAGPNQNAFFPTNFVAPNPTVDTKLVRYLSAQQGATKYLVATVSSADADAFILATNKPVMALGGVAGSDPILTPASIQTLVTQNAVRFFFLNSGVAQNGVAAHEWITSKPFPIANWVNQNCKVVPTGDWASSPQSVIAHDGIAGTMQLFDCAGAQ